MKKKKKTPKKILLDEWHVEVFIRPKKNFIKNDVIRLRALMDAYLKLLSKQVESDLDSMIQVRISQ